MKFHGSHTVCGFLLSKNTDIIEKYDRTPLDCSIISYMPSEKVACVHYGLQYMSILYMMVHHGASCTFEALVDQSLHEAEGRTHNDYKTDAWQAGSLAK